MAFKPLRSGKQKPQLHSLVDLAFILLLFFLVTSMMVQLAEKEQKLSLPTPENKPGRAQILVQLVDANQFIFLDQSANSIVQQVNNNYGFRSEEWRRQEIIRMMMSKMLLTRTQVLEKLAALRDRAAAIPEEINFVLIRCPDELPYYHVIDIIQAVSGLPNIQYGCTGGSPDDIRNARRIYLREESEANGVRRENLVIDFPVR